MRGWRDEVRTGMRVFADGEPIGHVREVRPTGMLVEGVAARPDVEVPWDAVADLRDDRVILSARVESARLLAHSPAGYEEDEDVRAPSVGAREGPLGPVDLGAAGESWPTEVVGFGGGRPHGGPGSSSDGEPGGPRRGRRR